MPFVCPCCLLTSSPFAIASPFTPHPLSPRLLSDPHPPPPNLSMDGGGQKRADILYRIPVA